MSDDFEEESYSSDVHYLPKVFNNLKCIYLAAQKPKGHSGIVFEKLVDETS